MTDPTQKPLPVRLGEALGNAYTIEGEIGRGGMGVVYRARDEKLKRRVAIKVLPPELAFNNDIRERFGREAQTAARLSHPHVVPIYTVGEGSALVYFIMGYVDGESLSTRIQRRGRLPAEEVRRIMKETADALSAAHGLAIIHRDIKPDNILLEGTRGRVMVTDFGIAKALSSVSGGTLTSAGVAIGTPSFMSPEQAAGEKEIDGRSDIYSLGVVAYQMATGELPFNAPTVAGILMKQITEPAPMVSAKRDDIPEDLALAIARCLEKDPENRWPTADSLRRSLENRTVTGYRPTGQTRRPSTQLPPSRRSPIGSQRPSTGARAPISPRPPSRVHAPLERARNRMDEEWGRPQRYERGGKRPSREEKENQVPDTGEPEIVQKVRNRFATWAATSGGCFMINVATGLDAPWFLFVAGGMGLGLLKDYAKMWQHGYSWRDVFNRPTALDSVDRALGKGSKTAQRMLAAPRAGDYGMQYAAMQQAYADRLAILKLIERLSPSERGMLPPDVLDTVNGLYERASNLAMTLHAMDTNLDTHEIANIDQRIAAIQREPDDDEKARRLGLLESKKRKMLELQERRDTVARHMDSCILAMQNVRFDLLRLRSADAGQAMGDLTQATMQARALSKEVDYAISAANEVRDAML
jgi:serine/threonine-protein kinase